MRALSLVALASLAACSLPSDNPSSVHDLRILAIQATPPELRYPVHGNYAEGQCNPDLSAIAGWGNVQLTALVADPNGNGRTLSWKWTECPQTSTEICPDDPAYVIATGSGQPSQIAATFPLTAEALTEEQIETSGCDGGCPPTPLLTTFANNPLGFCRFGVWLQVGLEVQAPDAGVDAGEYNTIYGSTLLVFTPVPDDYPTDGGCPLGPDGGMPPHDNPTFSVLQLDGTPLPIDSTLTVPAGVSHTVTPLIPSNGEQPYCLPTFQGGWVQLTETWLFSLMTTVGTFSEEQVGAGGFGNLNGGAINLADGWSTPGDGGAAIIYSIVRDGRGGTSWITRNVDLQPEP
jgi:hypothetical protein